MFTAYKKFWTHYADFEGKSTRSDYWWSVLYNVLITLPFGIMAFGSILVAIFNVVQQATYYDYEGGFDLSIFISSLGFVFFIIILLSIFGIATLVPNLAIIVHHLRDAGYHWAFIFLYVAPAFLMWVRQLKYNLWFTKDNLRHNKHNLSNNLFKHNNLLNHKNKQLNLQQHQLNLNKNL